MTTTSVDLARVHPDPELVGQVPIGMIRRLRAIPVCRVHKQVQIVFALPPASGGANSLELADCRPSTRVVEYFNSLFSDCAFIPAAERDFRQWCKRHQAHAMQLPVKVAEVDSVAEVSNLLRTGCLRRASDIHIVPHESSSRVHFRIDGQLRPIQSLEKTRTPQIVNRLKVLGGLDIAEQRQPQDGRFSFTTDDAQYEIRIATIPSRHGEKVTLRLLTQNASAADFESLGLTPQQSSALRKQLFSPTGLVLLTGPTGSGKSTTLFAAISQLIRCKGGNVITVEDPIEYEIESATQIQVNQDDKLTFPNALRSILRHDPDTILIGEIRDSETAQLAVQAAMTGHLVLSTLHTSAASGAATRLCELGVEPFLVNETLRMVLAQRLVRSLCVHCRERTEADIDAWQPAGCVYCGGTGALGRVGLFETLEYDCAEDYAPQTLAANGATVLGSKVRHLSWADCARYHVEQGRTWRDEVGSTFGGQFDAGV